MPLAESFVGMYPGVGGPAWTRRVWPPSCTLRRLRENDTSLPVARRTPRGRAGILLQSFQPLPQKAVLTALINGLTSLSGDTALVLDDYHLIEAQPIYNALAFLVENMPRQMHFVVASRTDPPLPLARRLVRDQGRGLRAQA